MPGEHVGNPLAGDHPLDPELVGNELQVRICDELFWVILEFALAHLADGGLVERPVDVATTTACISSDVFQVRWCERHIVCALIHYRLVHFVVDHASVVKLVQLSTELRSQLIGCLHRNRTLPCRGRRFFQALYLFWGRRFRAQSNEF